ncbi:hypothetical protein D9M68_552930 [compost metagenome]
MDQDVGFLELNPHLLGVGDEIRREITAIELHAFDDFQLRHRGLGFLDGDHSFVADLFHRFCEEAANLGVAIGRDGANLGDLVVPGDFTGVPPQFLDHCFDCFVDAALEVHRVHARRHSLRTFLDDRLSENSSGGGTVTSDVTGLRGNLPHHLCAHILELVLKLDLLGDGDAVLGYAGRAV